MVTVNFADTGDLEFGAIPSGKYHAKITGGEMREAGPNSKNPGSQYVNWEFTIQQGSFEDRKVWTNTSLLPQALFGLKALLLASGRYTKEQLAEELTFDIDTLVSSDVVITVGQREYNGDVRNEVKRYAPYDAETFSTSASSGNMLP